MIRTILVCPILILTLIPAGILAQAELTGPECVVFDAAHDRYLVSNWSSGRIVELDLDGNIVDYFGSQLAGAGGSCIVGNTFYVATTQGVTGFDLDDGLQVFNVPIPGTALLNCMTSDGVDYLYITDADPNRIYRVRISDHTWSVYVDSDPALVIPVGLTFDAANNRLLATTRPDGPEATAGISAVSLADGSVTEVARVTFDYLDALTFDNDGNFYSTVSGIGFVVKYDASFSLLEVISAGHGWLGQLTYNRRDDVLAVPDFARSTVHLIDCGDPDEDDVPNYRDNCTEAANTEQADADLDGIGDACDDCTDTDGDGYANPGFDASTCAVDNCPQTPNPGQYDWDGDGVGDECDNCLAVSNPLQVDTNDDGVGDACEGCCVGRVGDANGLGGDEPTIGDVSVMIDAKFITGLCDGILDCLAEADINQSGATDPACGDITIGDISTLIDYLFITGSTLGLADCL